MMSHSSTPLHGESISMGLDKLGPGEQAMEDLEPAATALGLVELLLKNPGKVDAMNRDPQSQADLFPRFLLITLTSYLIYACLMVLVLNLAPATAYPRSPLVDLPPADWRDGSALALPFAYAVGMILAACVCLPSFYFYSLLAGVRMSWLQITGLIGKGMAANAIFLLGVTPIYVIVVLGAVIFTAPPEWLQVILWAGLLLPFLSGLWGLRAIFLGLMDLSTTLPPEWQCRRRCFLRRLVVSWTAVYAAVVPLMIFRLWEFFAL